VTPISVVGPPSLEPGRSSTRHIAKGAVDEAAGTLERLSGVLDALAAPRAARTRSLGYASVDQLGAATSDDRRGGSAPLDVEAKLVVERVASDPHEASITQRVNNYDHTSDARCIAS